MRGSCRHRKLTTHRLTPSGDRSVLAETYLPRPNSDAFLLGTGLNTGMVLFLGSVG